MRWAHLAALLLFPSGGELGPCLSLCIDVARGPRASTAAQVKTKQLSQAKVAFNIPPGPTEIAGLHHSFVLPEGFARDPETKRQVYRDKYRTHAVRIEIYQFAGDEQAFLDEHYPESTRYRLTLKSRDASMMTTKGSSLRVTAAVIAREGKIYELACSQESTIVGDGPDATCMGILRSFEVK